MSISCVWMAHIYQNKNLSDQVLSELVINFVRETDEFLTCGHLGYGQTIYWQFRNWLSSGNDAWSFFQQWSVFFPLFPGAISALETLNMIFLSRSCIKLYSLALCIIQCLSTFRLKLLSKRLFLQFWRHFPPYAVLNAVFRRCSLTFSVTWKASSFYLQSYLGSYKVIKYLIYWWWCCPSAMRRVAASWFPLINKDLFVNRK